MEPRPCSFCTEKQLTATSWFQEKSLHSALPLGRGGGKSKHRNPKPRKAPLPITVNLLLSLERKRVSPGYRLPDAQKCPGPKLPALTQWADREAHSAGFCRLMVVSSQAPAWFLAWAWGEGMLAEEPLHSGQCGVGGWESQRGKFLGAGAVCCGCPGIPDKAGALGSRGSYQPESESSRSPKFMVKSRRRGERMPSTILGLLVKRRQTRKWQIQVLLNCS